MSTLSMNTAQIMRINTPKGMPRRKKAGQASCRPAFLTASSHQNS
jgi:hypothetical protein